MTCELIIWDPSRTFVDTLRGPFKYQQLIEVEDSASLVPRTQAVLIANTPAAEIAYSCILIPKFVSVRNQHSDNN